MNELLKVDIDTQTVSARDLHEQLNIGTKFTTWFERMCEYGFAEGIEFFPKMGETSEQGGRPATDYNISIDMAKQICMIQRTPEGMRCSRNGWKRPQQVVKRYKKLYRTISRVQDWTGGFL